MAEFSGQQPTGAGGISISEVLKLLSMLSSPAQGEQDRQVAAENAYRAQAGDNPSPSQWAPMGMGSGVISPASPTQLEDKLKGILKQGGSIDSIMRLLQMLGG